MLNRAAVRLGAGGRRGGIPQITRRTAFAVETRGRVEVWRGKVGAVGHERPRAARVQHHRIGRHQVAVERLQRAVDEHSPVVCVQPSSEHTAAQQQHRDQHQQEHGSRIHDPPCQSFVAGSCTRPRHVAAATHTVTDNYTVRQRRSSRIWHEAQRSCGLSITDRHAVRKPRGSQWYPTTLNQPPLHTPRSRTHATMPAIYR